MSVRATDLILLAVALGLLLPAVFVIWKVTRSKPLARVSWRRNMLIAGVYLLLLVLAIPVFYSLPVDDARVYGRGSEIRRDGIAGGEETETDPRTLTVLRRLEEEYSPHALTFNDLEDAPGIYKKGSRTFELAPNTTQVKYLDVEGNKKIFIERKAVNDGRIDVHTYYSRVVLSGADITALITPSEVTFSDGTLVIGPQKEQKFNFVGFKRDFTISQFTDPRPDRLSGIRFDLGWEIILIRIPPSLDIEEQRGLIY